MNTYSIKPDSDKKNYWALPPGATDLQNEPVDQAILDQWKVKSIESTPEGITYNVSFGE